MEMRQLTPNERHFLRTFVYDDVQKCGDEYDNEVGKSDTDIDLRRVIYLANLRIAKEFIRDLVIEYLNATEANGDDY